MRKILCILALFTCSLSGEIIQTPHFNEIIRYITPKTLVILDIDDTLLIPVQALGTDTWFTHRLKSYNEAGLAPVSALDKALAEWEAIRHLTEVKIVEEGSEKVVSKMQDDHFTVMGLTTQGLGLSTRTIKQLLSLHVDLSKTAPSHDDHYFLNGEGVLYRKGILFTAGSPKGKALLKLLDLIDYHPEKIVFINDKETHLRDVEKEVVVKGISFIGLRYSYSDERVKNYRHEIADIQWKRSSPARLLSDQEAEALIGK